MQRCSVPFSFLGKSGDCELQEIDPGSFSSTPTCTRKITRWTECDMFQFVNFSEKFTRFSQFLESIESIRQFPAIEICDGYEFLFERDKHRSWFWIKGTHQLNQSNRYRSQHHEWNALSTKPRNSLSVPMKFYLRVFEPKELIENSNSLRLQILRAMRVSERIRVAATVPMPRRPWKLATLGQLHCGQRILNPESLMLPKKNRSSFPS